MHMEYLNPPEEGGSEQCMAKGCKLIAKVKIDGNIYCKSCAVKKVTSIAKEYSRAYDNFER